MKTTKPSPWAWAILSVGASAVVAGVALIYVPAAVITGGILFGAFGLFVFDPEGGK